MILQFDNTYYFIKPTAYSSYNTTTTDRMEETTVIKKTTKKGDRKAKSTASEKKEKRKKQPGWMSELRYGQTISLNFFRTNAWLLTVIVVALLGLMGLRYRTKTRMLEIKQLDIELQRAESYKLQEKAKYMSLIRESEMRKMVAQKGLDLQFQEQPPYRISE